MLKTASGSGGSRIGILTTFESGGEDDYKEIRDKVDNMSLFLGETALLIKRPDNPTTIDWLGKRALLPQLDLPRMEDVTSLHIPLEDNSTVNRAQYN